MGRRSRLELGAQGRTKGMRRLELGGAGRLLAEAAEDQRRATWLLPGGRRWLSGV